MKKYLITGGSGFIGSRLVQELEKSDNKITILTRKKNQKSNEKISYISNLDEENFDYDVVINLQGEPISQRWTKSKKEEIYKSRIEITKKIVEKINNAKIRPSLFISGSAVGYYGTSDTEIFNEKSDPTNQKLFSQLICKNWEDEAKKVNDKTRLVLLRTGVVVGKNGGIIKKMSLPFKLGVGGKIASGRQAISWIHLDDEVRAILHIIEHQEISGAVNLVCNADSNLEFSKQLAKALNRPCIFTIPALTMKIAYGEMADELLLNGQNVYAQVLLKTGFRFKYENLFEAIKASI